MSFEAFVQTLADRKRKALFIDKHFRPCTAVGTVMTLEEVKAIPAWVLWFGNA